MTAIVNQWKEYLNSVSNYVGDFERALDDMESDADFMKAYGVLVAHCGDILDGVQLPLGDLDDLRAAVTGKGVQ